MRALKKRLEKIEKACKPQQGEPIVIERVIVEPDGTESGVLRRETARLSAT